MDNKIPKAITIFTNMSSLLVASTNTNNTWPQSFLLPSLPSESISTEPSTPIGEDSITDTLTTDVVKFLNSTKELKENFACGHLNRKHYAKNMCSNCYHKGGRTKLSWNCEHNDRPLYARGMCQVCYLHNYHKARTAIRKSSR